MIHENVGPGNSISRHPIWVRKMISPMGVRDTARLARAERWVISGRMLILAVSSLCQLHRLCSAQWKYEYEFGMTRGGTRLRSSLRHYITSWKVAGSIPDEVSGFFQFT
jgi:hypothetical protein